MKIFHNLLTKLHNPSSSYEGPYRLSGLRETIAADELTELIDLAEQFLRITHSSRHLQKIRGACTSRIEMAEVQLSPESYESVRISAALALLAAKECGFAITRPPGHHASKERAEGFCLVNNIAVATNYLLEQGKRVAIVDFDGHHGNGTEAIFRQESRVFYASIHQQDVYPWFNSEVKIGTNEAQRRIINIPVPSRAGDDILLCALSYIVSRVQAFGADTVAVSAGFDGYGADKLLELNYSISGFFQAGRILASLRLPLFAVLEGGYHDKVAECVEAFIDGVTGLESSRSDTLTTSISPSLEQVTALITKFRSNAC